MSKAKIYYYDIGDYLSREEKLKIIKDFKSMSNLPFKMLKPNEHGDWINKRSDSFSDYIPIFPEKNFNSKTQGFFIGQSNGLKTGRDAWSYNFSKKELENNISQTISFYNKQRDFFSEKSKIDLNLKVKEYINYDNEKISWDDYLIRGIKNNQEINFAKLNIQESIYRPFVKLNLYNEKKLIQRTYQIPKLFPDKKYKNIVICVPGLGSTKSHSVLITNHIPDLGFNSASQCFPLYYYEEREKANPGLFDAVGDSEYIRRDGVYGKELKSNTEKM